ncbi:MAG: hypothetical protein ACREB8_05300 [Pseudolabrys sp.]
MGLLAVSIVLWAVMYFGTLAHLSAAAEGAQPFDLRPRGYSVGEARALLTMLGDAGRAYYADVQLALDTVYPATYALSRALAIWWLTMPGRPRAAPLMPALRWILIVPPVTAAVFDYWENSLIRKMLAAGPAVAGDLVHMASVATQLKAAAGALSEVTMIAFAVVVFVRWWRRAGA